MNLEMGIVLSAAVAASCLARGAGLCRGAEPASPASQPATQSAGELQAPGDAEFKASCDGSVQRYMIALPKGFDASAPHDLLMAFHGHGSDRRQYMTDSRGSLRGVRDVAAKCGLILVTPDYRATTSWMGPAAEADTVQLIGELRKQYKVGKVFLVGGSMGGASVLTFTVLHPDLVDGVISQNGTANLLEYDVNYVNIQYAIKDSFGGGKDETPEQYKKRNPEEYRKRSAEFHAEKFTMPVAFMVGGKDDIVPPQSVRRLAKAVQKKNPSVLVIDRPDVGHECSYEDSVASLEFVIQAVRKGPK
jgi:pimeloyl-ACP methyl ester carboxylesterase